MISIAVIDDLDTFHPIASEWWKAHGWHPVPKGILPRLGVRAMDGTRPLAAAWLYMDNSVGVAMLEWIVTNPENTPRQTAAALLRLVDFLKQEALDLNYNVILATCRQKSLAALLGRAGFTQTDTDVIHLCAAL